VCPGGLGNGQAQKINPKADFQSDSERDISRITGVGGISLVMSQADSERDAHKAVAISITSARRSHGGGRNNAAEEGKGGNGFRHRRGRPRHGLLSERDGGGVSVSPTSGSERPCRSRRVDGRQKSIANDAKAAGSSDTRERVRARASSVRAKRVRVCARARRRCL
jgi:hypothetical protein